MASELQITFGERVRARREELGWSQSELAKKLKKRQPDVCDMEKGRHSPTLETIEEVAKVLKVKPASLID